MFDMLPFPNVVSNDAKGQVGELTGYLIQFKETLEFILKNISFENLSPELTAKLESLGAEVEKTNEDKEEELQYVRTLTASEVIATDAFKNALNREYVFTVNFNTGEIEYTKPS